MKKVLINSLILILFVSCIFITPAGELSLQNTLLDDQFIVSLVFENDGTAWAGIIRDQYGLVKIDPDGSTEIFDHTNSCLHDSSNIWDIDIDSQGKVWMLNDDGLICYDGDEFTRYDSIDGFYIPKSFDNLLAVDNDDKVWLIGYNPWVNCPTQRIVSFDGVNFTSYEPTGINLDLCYNTINDIEIDKLGNIWFAFHRGEPVFLKYDGSEWTSYDTDDIGFEPYRISDIEFDSDNNLWFNDDIALSSMYYEDHAGLYCFDGEHQAEGFGDMNLVSQLSVDDNDNIWMTGFSPRLAVLNINHKYTIDDSDDVGYCRVMEMGPNGDMWLGTSTGIKIYRYSQAK